MTDPPEGAPVNRLAGETSAYLRQHMRNPVDWYPWGPEALERARAEDKPLLVSIGYSACHWCHVMAHESFEDPKTAALMNELYVNIKVDREERPDLDQLFMDMVTGLSGHGGWPLTAFCTSDGRPFYGGTYYPPTSRHGLPAFRDILTGIANAYRSRRDEIDQNAAHILGAIGQRADGAASNEPDAQCAAKAAMALLRQADPVNGGFGGAPKFPTPTALDLLLAAADILPERKAREAVEHVVQTCKAMARGGLYDHLGGGFHRYSVDATWGVPHFEKMLYDQGQLVRVYIEAARRSPADAEELLWPVRETIRFLSREMTGPEGGFYASQDADSEGEEGTYYVWTPAQVKGVLGERAGCEFAETYGVSERGNFEHGTTVLRDIAGKARDHQAVARESLLAARSRRVAPDTDTKRVAAWNALAISGLARAAGPLEDDGVLRDAVTAANFVFERMRDGDGRLLRVWNTGRAHVPAFLDDHAALLEAALDLHRAGAGDRFFAAARELASELATRFFDDDVGDFFLTPSDGEALPQRPRSDHDGATPHSAGLAVLGLLRVANLAEDAGLTHIADRVIASHALALERAPHAFPTLARAILANERGISVAVIVGAAADPRTAALAARARRVLLPEDAVLVAAPGAPAPPGIAASWLAGRGTSEGPPTASVCRGHSCSLPVSEPDLLEPLDAAAP